MKPSKLFLAMISSIAVGALAGVLFAPKKGKDTRKNISEQSKEFIDGISEKLESISSDGFEKKVHSRPTDL